MSKKLLALLLLIMATFAAFDLTRAAHMQISGLLSVEPRLDPSPANARTRQATAPFIGAEMMKLSVGRTR